MTNRDDGVGQFRHGRTRRVLRRVVELDPGDAVEHDRYPWQEAIVFMIAGELEITCTRGECHRFRAGDVLTLARLPILRAWNSGSVTTRLLLIWRRLSTP